MPWPWPSRYPPTRSPPPSSWSTTSNRGSPPHHRGGRCPARATDVPPPRSNIRSATREQKSAIRNP
eukprot:12625832-Alexandrium_andersonii.AAC.1